MILGIFEVSGHSMLPTLKPKDRVLVSSLPYIFAKPKKKDIVVFKNQKKIIIKRISRILKTNYEVLGDNRRDSLKIEPLKKSAILGKVILVIN